MAHADALDSIEALHGLTARAEALTGVDGAPELARAIQAWGMQLAGLGLPGALLGRWLGALNDRLARRVIALVEAEQRLPQVPWVWLALGSQGRDEQTFYTDQDNGLIFSAVDAAEAEALRASFLPFCQRINTLFDACGFSLCSGGIMAGNPSWCLSAREWQQCFAGWIRRPEGEALLQATIFFDFRPLHGDASLAENLREELLAMTRDTPVFLHLMAGNALRADVPLGRLGDIHWLEVAGGRRVLDLKHCARIVVDAARIFALAGGGYAVDTVTRLAESGPAAGLTQDETRALIDAFSALLRIRYTHQTRQIAAGQDCDNLIDPEELHVFDRAALKTALQQIRGAQQRLRLNYGF